MERARCLEMIYPELTDTLVVTIMGASAQELYNLGHLYEAGVAHYQATGKSNLLEVCLKSADLIDRDFGKGELKIAPGGVKRQSLDLVAYRRIGRISARRTRQAVVLASAAETISFNKIGVAGAAGPRR